MDPQDQLLIQSHFALVWWAEALTANHFQSNEFQQLRFANSFVQKRLAEPGGAAKSLIAPCLYVALVLPREAVFKKYEDDFKRIDEQVARTAKVLANNYPSTSGIAFTRHLRNATAHARVAFTADGIEFKDEDKKNRYRLHASIDFSSLGNLVHELQLLLVKHVKFLQLSGA